MKVLCHYTSNDVAKIILNNMTLQFGKVASSNDPVEIKNMNFDYSGNDEDTHNIICNDLKEYLNSILQLICFSYGEYPFEDKDYIDEHAGILFEEKVRPPFYLPRTWALYGKNHSGACLVFEKSLFLAQTSNQIKANYKYYHGYVKYKDFIKNGILYDMSQSYIFDEAELKTIKPFNMVQKYLDENVEFNYLQKDIDWRDEKEYRILCWNKRKNSDYSNVKVGIKGSIRAVVLGLKNNDNNLIEIAKRQGISVYQLIFDDIIQIVEK
jgi:hypothetical protein